ncbi:MAG: tetratricopeptide repeat protein [Candidatus Sumerlaeaceae bacterium]|nr:tetratricopeptide repeat protein [Candidatus Sumerlaeaceae bacterium]
MSKQELKHDELEDVFDRLALWYHRNAKWIQWVVFVALVLFIGTRLYRQYQETRFARATAELGKAQSALASALMEASENKRKELFATAITEAERLVKDYGTSFHGREALLLLGNAHYYYSLALANQKSEAAAERKAAREAFEKLLSVAKTPEEKAAAYLGLGNVLENELFATRDMTLLKQAADYYSEAKKLAAGSYLAAEADLALARMYQPVSDKRDEAERTLNAVIKTRSEMRGAQMAVSDKETKQLKFKSIEPEKARELQNFEKLTYAAQAKDLLASLKGFEPAKEK